MQVAVKSHPQSTKKLVPFLRKLLQLCDVCENELGGEIARWSLDGSQFDVLENAEFVSTVERVFDGRLETFMRQLHFYGFSKIDYLSGGGDSKTVGTWSFRHVDFVRDDPSAVYRIKRYARATDRENGEDSSSDKEKIDVLKGRVLELESALSDLSRRFNQMQLELKKKNETISSFLSLSPKKPVPVPRKRVRDADVIDVVLPVEEPLLEVEDGASLASAGDFDDMLPDLDEELPLTLTEFFSSHTVPEVNSCASEFLLVEPRNITPSTSNHSTMMAC